MVEKMAETLVFWMAAGLVDKTAYWMVGWMDYAMVVEMAD